MHNQLDAAIFAYEQALRHNMYSTQTLNAISQILRTKEQYTEASEFLRHIIKMEPANGEAWGNLGHCHLMMDNLQDAYTAYQQALYYLSDPKVCALSPCDHVLLTRCSGAQALVRYRYLVRQIRLSGTRRGGILPGHAHGAGFREGQRDILQTRDNLQATEQVPAESRGMQCPHCQREVANLHSASNTLCRIPLARSTRRIFGSRLVMSTNSRKT